jgi:DNA-binding SARP family transcriptional activator
VLLAIRRGQFAQAQEAAFAIDLGRPFVSTGFRSRILAYRALAAALNGDPNAKREAQRAVQSAEMQGASLWQATASLVFGRCNGTLGAAINGLARETRVAVSFTAELIVDQMSDLDAGAMGIIEAEARRVPERWRPVLREVCSRPSTGIAAARLLDLVGDASDVQLLRRFARQGKRSGLDRQLGRGLARRLAPVAEIHDLGRVGIRIGNDEKHGGDVRRKVLSLLCFLLTRPRWAATREEVMEAMWPGMDPAASINSLNQSVYFLRRVFEAEYAEETTAGYLHQDSDLLWLDSELVQADSAKCAEWIGTYGRTGDPEVASKLADAYTGRFALDFAYDEWSADFREWLHVSWLHVVETQIRADADAGQFDRGIRLARKALEIEPRNDELELSMLRLLRRSGAHSAAAEQYVRYANVLRTDLGVEPPPLDAV